MRHPMRGVLVLALAVVCGGALVAQSGAVSATDLAARLQKRYATIHDFTADFTQTSRTAGLPQKSVTTGKVLIKKPARMRWTYEKPEKNELVADGTLVWWYVPADRRVERSEIPQGNDVSTAILFLAGKGDLVRDFTASLPAAQPANGWRLDLVPKSKQAEFDKLSLMVDRDLKFTGFETLDSQGQTLTFEFSKLRENVGLSDNAFIFKPPPGVDVEVVK